MMKKYFLMSLLIAIVPNMVFGSSARYTQLVREKQRKMEELEKCMGTSKGLQIAGISTLGLTAVGVAGNIYEAKLIKDNDKAIEKKDKSIQDVTAQIEKKKAERDEKLKAQEQLTKCIDSAKSERDAGSNPAKITAAVFDEESNECTVTDCGVHFKVSDSKKTCVPEEDETKVTEEKEEVTPEESKDFSAKCIELGGEPNTNTITKNIKGEVLSVAITVRAGCKFTNAEGLDNKCAQLKDLTNSTYNTHIDRNEFLCAFIEAAEWKCLSGEEVCYSDKKESDTKAQPSQPDGNKSGKEQGSKQDASEAGNSTQIDKDICEKDYGGRWGTKVCFCPDQQNQYWDLSKKACIDSDTGEPIAKKTKNITTPKADKKPEVTKKEPVKKASEIKAKPKQEQPKAAEKAVAETKLDPKSISLFNNVEVGNLDQCKALVTIYAKQNGLNLTYKSKENKSHQEFLTYENSSNKQEYIFEFDDCSETFPSAFDNYSKTLKALCVVYGSTPSWNGSVMVCPVSSKTEEEINFELGYFNSHYHYKNGGFVRE